MAGTDEAREEAASRAASDAAAAPDAPGSGSDATGSDATVSDASGSGSDATRSDAAPAAAGHRSRLAGAAAFVRAQPRKRLALAGAALAAGIVAVGLLARAGGEPPAAALADAVPFDGRSPREPSGQGTRVIVALPRPSLGRAGIDEPGEQREYVRSLADESRALRSALEARGIRLSEVVAFTRTFNGFAATVRTSDLADLPSLGVRAQPVRRFYPASSEPARVPGLRAPGAAPPLGGAPVAVLDTGVDLGHPLLDGRLDPGYDAVADDDDPARPAGSHTETSGTALAGVLVAAGERVLPIRIAG